MAHRLALVAEADIRDRLTEQAMAVLFSASAITEADWAAMAMTDAELLGWLTSHAIELTSGVGGA